MSSVPQSRQRSDLRLRVISALVLGPVVLGVTYLGGPAFTLLMLVAAVLFLWEWFSITGMRHPSAGAIAGQGSLVALAVLQEIGLPGVGLGLILLAAVVASAINRFSRIGRWGGEGILYSGVALYALIAVRSGDIGLQFSFFLLFLVWATDIFAYFTGRALGGPKLWERVSPKKTWSGALGGLAFAVVFGVLAVIVLGGSENLVVWGVLACVLSIVSQAGDLLESAVKRRFDVKDSSRLIPGHGGIMDRIDGLVAAGICAVLLGLASGGSLQDPIAGLALK